MIFFVSFLHLIAKMVSCVLLDWTVKNGKNSRNSLLTGYAISGVNFEIHQFIKNRI